MGKASNSEGENNFSELVDSAKRGWPLLIVDRGRPVVRFEPVSGQVPATTTDSRDSFARPSYELRA